MKFERLECVVLAHDAPKHSLQTGDLGTIVEVYPGSAMEVEFVKASGVTQALLTLKEHDVRKLDSNDLLATRRLAGVT